MLTSRRKGRTLPGVSLAKGCEPAPLQGLLFFNSNLLKHTARIGNILRGTLIGGATATIGYGMGAASGNIFHDLGKFGTGVLSAMSGGAVGGLSSIAMSGSFSEGFKTGFISAGLSYAVNEIAGAIEAGISGGGIDPDPTQPIPTEQIKKGEKVLIVYTEFDPMGVIKLKGQKIELYDMIEKDAKLLAEQLNNRGVQATAKEYASWEAFKSDFNKAPGQWNHVILVGHNYGGIKFSEASSMPIGGMKLLSDKTILPGGSMVIASCYSALGPATRSSYLMYAQIAETMYGSTSKVNFNAIIDISRLTYSAGTIKGTWWSWP